MTIYKKTKTKTWKLGEVCKGGIITVEITGKIVVIIGKDWDYSTGSRKSSDQSNAKEWTRGTCDTTAMNAYRNMLEFLQDLTTSYYAEKVMEWIGTQVKLDKSWY